MTHTPSEPKFLRRGWFALRVIDGRSFAEADKNAPFAPRHEIGMIVALLALLAVLVVSLSAAFLRPMFGESGTIGPVTLTLPTMTQAQREALIEDPAYQSGIVAGRLPPWGRPVPEAGVSHVSDPIARRKLQVAIDRMDRLGKLGDYGMSFASTAAIQAVASGPDRTMLSEAREEALALREEFRALDQLLGQSQTVTPYHRGVLSLWLSDAPGAIQEFDRVLALVAETRARPNPSGEAGMRLDSLEAAALYGRALAEAGLAEPDFKKAVVSLDAAITAAAGKLDSYTVYRAADNRALVLDKGDHLVFLDLGDMRADHIALLLRSGDRAAAEKAAETLFQAGDAPRNPFLSANLQLLAAGKGESARVEALAFEGPRIVSPAAAGAQALARTVTNLPNLSDGQHTPTGVTADLIHLQELRSALIDGLAAGEFTPPSQDYDFNDPARFTQWKRDIGRQVAVALLRYGAQQQRKSPARTKAVYELITANASWLPSELVLEARVRLATGQSLRAIGLMLAGLVVVMVLARNYLAARRKGYRELMQSHHYLDRLAGVAA